MSGKKRKRWSASEKLRIVLAGLDGTIEISELCRREGINPAQYYGWKKRLVSAAVGDVPTSCGRVLRAAARHPGREKNLKLRQRTLPLEAGGVVA